MERQRGACAKPRASRWVLRHAPCEKTRGPEIKENVSLDSCHDTCRYDICRPDTCRPDFSDPIFADTNTCRYDTCRSDICRSDFCRLDPFRSLLYLTYTPWSVCCCGGIILRAQSPATVDSPRGACRKTPREARGFAQAPC
uniref:Uncharacterized protein n=1 Tax=Meloidogyne enterolobii TaxID=390850 RepID=A0A6V7W9U5_MELEN|nr:unnamed protein product [Meloidogyne enterolobii]